MDKTQTVQEVIDSAIELANELTKLKRFYDDKRKMSLDDYLERCSLLITNWIAPHQDKELVE